MKRFLALAVTLSLILGAVVFPTQAFGQTNVKDGALELLAYLEIMTGDPDGSMRLDDSVSRAEFSKMAVASSTFKNSVAAGLALSPFPDVTYKHWAAPYVRVAVSNGIVSGYPDGTFEPENTVLYEEAVTMMLRVLGYNDDDFGNSWPAGQLGIADNIDLTDDIERSQGEIMTRRDVAQLVYNALKTDIKTSGAALSAAVFDVSITEDATIVASHLEDTSIASDSVLTSSGTYKLDIDLNNGYVGLKGDIAVKNNKKLVGFVPHDESGAAEEYIVYSAFDNKVLAYKNGTITQIDVNDATAVYKGTSQTSFAMIKQELELGDRLMVRRLSAGDIDYITYVKGNLLGPITAMGGNWQSIWSVPDDAKITRDGATVTTSAIQTYDIVYYLPDMNMVMAYNDKVTGIYETAEPNRDAPTAITVSGRSYSIEGSAAFNKIHSGGDFEYGDTVMLLLGKDGEIADVISPSASTDDVVGYLVGTGTKEYSSGIDTFKNYYIRLVHTDGNTYEYVTDRDYAENLNSVVEISFSNGYARISEVHNSISGGSFNWSSKKLGSDKVSSSINILDIGTKDSNSGSMYAKVYGQRLDGLNISSKKILYAEKNSSGEITDLILYDVTGDAYSYGIVIGASTRTVGKENENSFNITSVYDYMVDGTRYTTSVSGDYSVSRGNAVKVSGNAAAPDALGRINNVSGAVASFTTGQITIGGSTHKISDKVSCYKRESAPAAEYSMISLNEVIENKDDYSVTAYYDRESSAGGRIRVILVTEKD